MKRVVAFMLLAVVGMMFLAIWTDQHWQWALSSFVVLLWTLFLVGVDKQIMEAREAVAQERAEAEHQLKWLRENPDTDHHQNRH